MTISLLSELWEQEVYNFLSEKYKTPKSNFYKDIKKVYDEYTGEDLDVNVDIAQMREVVNAIKHGEDCISFLQQKYPNEDFLATAWNEIGANGELTSKKRFEFDKNALTSQTLNLDGKFEKYQKAIIDFWINLFRIEDEKTQQPGAK